MPSFAHLTAVLALTGSALSAPTIQKRGFSIHQVENKRVLKNGPAELVATLKKFGKTVPKYLVDAAQSRADAMVGSSDNASVTATPSDQYDSSYLCPVTVGSSTLQLDFDTGSSDLWVFSSLQSASERGQHNYYKVDSSKEMKGYSWNISYGDGSGASGKVYADTVVVGGVTATKQAVEAATSVSAEFTNDTSTDGLLGLAFSSINTVQPKSQLTFFDNVKSSLPQPIFCADLKYHSAGSYDFGYTDSSKFTGDITYVDVDNSQGFWGFSASGYGVGSGNGTQSASISAIADTGTTLIYIDDSIVSDYYGNVDGAQEDDSQGGYTFPCSSSTPDFVVQIGDGTFTVPGQYINFAPTDETGQTCFGGIQSNSQIGLTIFGDVFLKAVYAVFDGGNTRIGFAQQPSQ